MFISKSKLNRLLSRVDTLEKQQNTMTISTDNPYLAPYFTRVSTSEVIRRLADHLDLKLSIRQLIYG